MTPLREWLARAPAGTMVPASEILAQLDASDRGANAGTDPAAAAQPASWRERLWTCPPETRLGVVEVAEALGRPRNWIHRHTSRKAGVALLPHRKLDGALVFVAREIRTWLAEHEEMGQESHSPTPSTSELSVVRGRRSGQHSSPRSA